MNVFVPALYIKSEFCDYPSNNIDIFSKKTKTIVCFSKYTFIFAAVKITYMERSTKKIQELTKAEFEIMQLVWQIGHEFVVRDIHNMMSEPRPAYNTVSTIVRILDSKGFLTHKTYGHSNVYFCAVSKNEYTGSFMQNVLTSFFGGSVSRLVNFFSVNKNISVHEADEILKMLKNPDKE